MLLYDESVSVNIPPEYEDISQIIAAQSYQYMFANQLVDTDDFIIIDLMEPEDSVDLHIVEIFEMNELKDAAISRMGYTSRINRKSLEILRERYGDPAEVEEIKDETQGNERIYLHLKGMVTGKDGSTKGLFVTIGVVKFGVVDLVLSTFKEKEAPHARQVEVENMLRTVELKKPELFKK